MFAVKWSVHDRYAGVVLYGVLYCDNLLSTIPTSVQYTASMFAVKWSVHDRYAGVMLYSTVTTYGYGVCAPHVE